MVRASRRPEPQGVGVWDGGVKDRPSLSQGRPQASSMSANVAANRLSERSGSRAG